MPEPAEVQRGLQDVVALESRICFIDGRQGRLIYQGYDIRDLAARSTFEEVCYLLWYGRVPSAQQLTELRARFGALRELPDPLRRLIDQMPIQAHPMDILRTSVSALALFELEETKPGVSSIGGAQRLTAVLPSILGHFHRRRKGLPPLAARPDLSQAAYLLYALLDREPSELETRAADVALILHADHELNASTFAARVVASTGADLYACIAGALAALTGPLHGGASDRVEALVDEVGSAARASDVLQARACRGDALPGFGHRLYPAGDPRVPPLLEAARDVGRRARKADRERLATVFAIGEAVERAGRAPPNLDFALVALARALGMRRGAVKALFAVGRLAGWVAHAIEQREAGFLLRPRAEYVGA